MHKTAAVLRHRELTQEIYNIGDEVAEYTEHLAEAIADYDGELTEDCLAEFVEIVDDARQDARRVVAELIGLRQALTSGLNDLYPLQAPFSVQTMQDALTGRTDLVVQHLGEVVSYCLEQTDMVARELGVVSLPHLYARVGEIVEEAVTGWVETVCVDHPAFARTMRGSNPPAFLEERARIDRIVQKVAAKRSRRGA